MAVMTLNSLVLRGLPVVRDGQAVDTRRGLSLATKRFPEVHFSIRHAGCQAAVPMPQTWYEPEAKCLVDNPTKRAGRSDCSIGVLTRYTPTSIVGGTVSSSRSRVKGGLCLAAAAASGPKGPRGWASAGKSDPRPVGLRPATWQRSLRLSSQVSARRQAVQQPVA